MPGRKRHHYKCPNTDQHSNWHGSIVNAYVRLGSPARWTVIGEVCINCGHFTKDVSFDRSRTTPANRRSAARLTQRPAPARFGGSH